tara:strand:- start:44 stop:1087 length:1044 start_codon:yes stop_codon:yes gene_type:complete
MSYNRPSTPRVYMDRLSYDIANGFRTISNYTIIQDDGSTAVTFDGGQIEDLFDLRPTNYATIANTTAKFYINLDTGMGTDATAETNFIAILGHNFHTSDATLRVQYSDTSDFSSGVTTATTDCTRIINAAVDGNTNYVDPASNGWTLLTWTDDGSAGNRYKRITIEDDDGAGSSFATDVKIGAIMMGEYIDFPNSPDLSVGFNIDYDGTNIVSSAGGSTFANTSHLGSPPWGASNPWVLSGEDTQVYKMARHYGRRKYNMNFSYVSDTDLFLSNMHAAHGAMIDGSDLYSQFINKALGSHLPFLFTIDKDSTDEGDYGLYRLADGGLKSTQTANRFWNVGLNLVEHW